MELQEYHVKRLFKQAGLPVLKGDVAYTPQEALAIARRLPKGPILVKAQALGRSSCYASILPIDTETDGCCCVSNTQKVPEAAQKLLGRPEWLKDAEPLFEIQKLYIEQAVPDAKVVGSLIFRVNFETQKFVLMLAPVKRKPVTLAITNTVTSQFWQRALKAFGPLSVHDRQQLITILQNAYHLFCFYGAVAVELNPIVRLSDGTFKVVDGRLVFDPNSVYKFPHLLPLIESRVGKEREKLARQNHFRYMGMHGNIACVVNGIGLGWATVDLIQRRGGKVATLLDVGTKPTKDVVSKAIKLVLSEPNVDSILVNIFGGLTRCDLIAEGLIEASPEIATGLPLVVRMDGINAEIGQRLLFESKLPFIIKTHINDAIRAVIKETKEKR